MFSSILRFVFSVLLPIATFVLAAFYIYCLMRCKKYASQISEKLQAITQHCDTISQPIGTDENIAAATDLFFKQVGIFMRHPDFQEYLPHPIAIYVLRQGAFAKSIADYQQDILQNTRQNLQDLSCNHKISPLKPLKNANQLKKQYETIVIYYNRITAESKHLNSLSGDFLSSMNNINQELTIGVFAATHAKE